MGINVCKRERERERERAREREREREQFNGYDIIFFVYHKML